MPVKLEQTVQEEIRYIIEDEFLRLGALMVMSDATPEDIGKAVLERTQSTQKRLHSKGVVIKVENKMNSDLAVAPLIKGEL